METRSQYKHRVDLQPIELENLVIQSANLLSLERAIFCPCRRIDNGSFQSNCPICHGNGWLFTGANEVFGTVTSLSYTQTMSMERELINSTANLTLSELYDFRLNYFDRITILDGDGIIKNNLIKIKLQYNAQKNEVLMSSVPFVPNSIEYFYVYFSSTEIVLLTENDYTLSNANIIFSDVMKSRFKKTGLDYLVGSIRYYHKAIYHVLNTNHNIRQTRVTENGSQVVKKLPLQYTIREALYDVKDNDVIL